MDKEYSMSLLEDRILKLKSQELAVRWIIRTRVFVISDTLCMFSVTHVCQC